MYTVSTNFIEKIDSVLSWQHFTSFCFIDCQPYTLVDLSDALNFFYVKHTIETQLYLYVYTIQGGQILAGYFIAENMTERCYKKIV